MRLHALIAILAICSSSVFAKDVKSPFTYSFYGTNVGAWAEGVKYGPVRDAKGIMAQALDRMLGRATKTVDAAFYGLEKQSWALTRMKRLVSDGVNVRFAVDQRGGEAFDWQDPTDFMYDDTVELASVLESGHLMADVRMDGTVRKNSIMHNKFAVVDKRYVWTGTANISATCMGDEYNSNMALMIDSPDLAAVYSAEFKQMFEDWRFSVAKEPRAKNDPLKYSDGTQVSVYFSPQDDPLTSAVIPFINAAGKTLDIGMFFLTDPAVTQAIVSAVEDRGVRVRVIYDALAAWHPSSQHGLLRKGGVEVRVENWGGKMHLKTAVADGANMLTGSMNWSRAGSRINDENVIVIRANRALAREFTTYFDGLWDLIPETSGNDDPRPESLASINSCEDGTDNDHDGIKDGAEPQCKQ